MGHHVGETNEIINLTACITEQCETYKTIYPHKSILFSNKVGNVDINASYFRICQLLDKLVNNAVILGDNLRHARQVPIEKRDCFFNRSPFREAGKST